MGWCHEFGSSINDGCAHPMVAGAASCSCGRCGTVCQGRFNGCAEVWARGPRYVAFVRPAAGGAGVTPPAPPAPPAAEEAAAEAGGDTLDSLRVALDAVRAELREMGEVLRRQQDALDRRAQLDEAYDRLVAVLDALREPDGVHRNGAGTGPEHDGEDASTPPATPAAVEAWSQWDPFRPGLAPTGTEPPGDT